MFRAFRCYLGVAVVLVALAGCATAPSVQPITSGEKIRVFEFYGLGGSMTSPGMDTIASRLRSFSGITVEGPFNYESWTQLEDAMRATPPGIKIVTLGYSCGNQSATGLPAADSDVPVALALGIQASVYCPPYALTPNVASAWEIYNPNFAATGGLGYAEWQPGPGFPPGRLTLVQTPDSHGYADEDPTTQNAIVTLIVDVNHVGARRRMASGVRHLILHSGQHL